MSNGDAPMEDDDDAPISTWQMNMAMQTKNPQKHTSPPPLTSPHTKLSNNPQHITPDTVLWVK
jgi:hypothetical protein